MSNMAEYYNPSGGGYTPPKSHTFLVPLIVVFVLFIAAAGFGVWAFMGRQDYKDNSDQKSAAAAQEARVKTQAEDAAKYAEEAKSPYKTFIGPPDFGSITVQYPKTWSAYAVQGARGSTPLDAYFHPDVVPDVNAEASVFALRIEVVDQAYDQVLNQFESGVEAGEVSVAPYKLAKVPSVIGSRVTGQIESDKRGTMVLFPLRNVTLKVWTETDQYLGDFDNIILPNMTFVP